MCGHNMGTQGTELAKAQGVGAVMGAWPEGDREVRKEKDLQGRLSPALSCFPPRPPFHLPRPRDEIGRKQSVAKEKKVSVDHMDYKTTALTLNLAELWTESCCSREVLLWAGVLGR